MDINTKNQDTMIKNNILVCYRRTRNFSSFYRCNMTFEGNTEGLHGTPEERMTTVFGGRLKGEAPNSTSRILSGGSKMIAGVPVPSKPIEPDNCCMSGCVNCVWEIFNDDIREWKRKRKLAAKNIRNTEEIWPANWNPPLALLTLKNVPESLKTEKIRYDKQEKQKKGLSTARFFPPKTGPLPKSVIEAKQRNALNKKNTANHPKTDEAEAEAVDGLDDDSEGWNDVPVYIRAFADFERKKKLLKKQSMNSSLEKVKAT